MRNDFIRLTDIVMLSNSALLKKLQGRPLGIDKMENLET